MFITITCEPRQGPPSELQGPKCHWTIDPGPAIVAVGTSIRWIFRGPEIKARCLRWVIDFRNRSPFANHKTRFEVISDRGQHELFQSSIGFEKFGELQGLASSTLSAEDIKDFPEFIFRLRMHADPVSDFLWRRFSSRARSVLSKYQPSERSSREAQNIVVKALNDMIEGPSIFESERFKSVSLTSATNLLKNQTQRSNYTAFLNRLLLEDAYPKNFSRNQGSWMKEEFFRVNHLVASEPARADEPGDYKYDVSVEDADDGLSIGEEDPWLHVVRPTFVSA